MDKPKDLLSRAAEIYEQAAQLEGQALEEFLSKTCGDDTDLVQEIRSLLDARADVGEFLASPTVATSGHGSHSLEPMPDLRGTMIGPYQLREEIGEGGFGMVYAASQLAPMKRDVAVKIIKLGMDTRQFVARFEAERQALALMDHPHIARVYDAGATESGRPYFVMEIIEGIPITKFCTAHALSTHDRLTLFNKVCAAVQHAHQKGVIHRDLKPSNVLVSMQDGVPTPKIIDFGIAKIVSLESGPDTISMTTAAQFVGTPEYMSPEQAERGSSDIDTRSDIYSLGVMLYELLTGVTPFDRDSLATMSFDEVQRTIRELEPARPSTRVSALVSERSDEEAHLSPSNFRESTEWKTLARQLRGDLDWIVMKALEKDRDRRYASASDLVADIERHLRNEAVMAGPPSRLYRFQKMYRRNRVAMNALAAMIVLLVLGTTGTSWGLMWALDERDIATTATQDARDAEQAAKDRAEEAELVIEFLEDVLTSVDPAAQGKDVLMIDVIGDYADKVDTRFEDMPELAVRLHCTLGWAYRGLGELNKAIVHTSRAVDIAELVLEIDDHQRLRTANQFAVILMDLGQTAEAANLLDQILDDFIRFKGDNDPGTLTVINNLATCYRRLGDFGSCERLHNRALAIRRETLGELHPDTLQSKENLTRLYVELGRYEDATTLAREAKEARIAQNGKQHPDSLRSMAMLADCYSKLGEYEEALALNLEASEISERALGSDHPLTIGLMYNVGNSYRRLGRFDEAAELLELVAERYSRKLGPEHSRVLSARSALALSKHRAGNHQEALELALEVAGVKRRVLGDDHPNTLRTLITIADIYRSFGDYGNAYEYQAQVYQARLDAMGSDNWIALRSVYNAACDLFELERFSEAEELYLMVLDSETTGTQTSPPAVTDIQEMLIEIYHRLGRTEKMHTMTGSQIELLIAATQSAQLTAKQHDQLARALLLAPGPEQYDPDRGMSHARQACAIEDDARGTDLCKYLDTLAMAQHRTGDHAIAVKTMKQAIELLPNAASNRIKGEFHERLAAYEAAATSAEENDENSVPDDG